MRAYMYNREPKDQENCRRWQTMLQSSQFYTILEIVYLWNMVTRFKATFVSFYFEYYIYFFEIFFKKYD